MATSSKGFWRRTVSTSPPIHPLGYENPSSPRRTIFSWNIFLTTAAVMLLYGGFFLIVVPSMERVYGDFKIALPTPTAIILRISHHMVPLGGVALACVPLTLAVLVPVLAPLPSGADPKTARRPYRRTAQFIRILLMLVLVAMVVAVVLPIYSLITAMTSVGK
jgi:type II secretory pathway component PulF